MQRALTFHLNSNGRLPTQCAGLGGLNKQTFPMIQDSGCLLLPANCGIKGKFVSLVLGQPITVRLWQEVIDMSI